MYVVLWAYWKGHYLVRKPACNAFKYVSLVPKAYIVSLSGYKGKMFHVIHVRSKVSCILFMVVINSK